MKNLFPPFAKLIAVAACALTLGSCSRAEYAMLPQGSSYHGVTRVATPVPAAPAPAAAVATEVASAPAAMVAPETKQAPQVTATKTPAAPAAAKVATAPVAAPAVASAAAPKLTLVQRLAMNKLTKKLQKAAQKSGLAHQHDNTASTQRLEGKLRQGLIFGLVGLLVEIVGAATGSGLIYLLGAILILIGIVLIILYLLDEL